MNTNPEDGVIKFELHFERTPLPHYDFFPALEAWRQRLLPLGLIGGENPDRYEGLGFGNISHRIEAGQQAFLISGTQTGHLAAMGAEHYSLVIASNSVANSIYAKGEIKPSSEAMTHAAIYDAVPAANAVIHVHGPEIWSQAASLGLAITDPAIAYGTTAMAAEFKHLIDSGQVTHNTISMGGHQDGVITWGDTLDQAGEILLMLSSRAGIDTDTSHA